MKIKKFKDFSIKQKLFTTLFLCTIVPMIALGGFFSLWMMEQEQEYNNKMELELIKQTHRDVDGIFFDVEDMAVNLLVNPWAKKAVLGIAVDKDFWEMKEWYVSATRNKGYFGGMVLSDEEGIVFQRGNLVEKELEENLERLKESDKGDFWSTPYESTTGNAIIEKPKIVISYYSAIMTSESAQATLSISVPEMAIRKEIGTYLYERGITARLVDKNGIMLSSMEGEDVGEYYREFENLKSQMNEGSGYFQANLEQGKSLILYTRSDVYGNYLIGVELLASGLNVGMRYFYGIFLAVFLCGVFGIVFAKIQGRYMIRPLEEVSREFGKIRKGDFAIDISYNSEDEIGTIGKEFVEVSERLEELIEEVYLSKIFNQEAELQLLTSQIDPHFLYNTLDSIHWLAVENGNYKVAEQIEALSDIFRHVLNRGKDMVTLKEEIEYVEHYMLIMSARYGERAKLKMNIDEELLDIMVPKLILQPLVENAMLHGLEPQIEGGTIKVTVKRKQENIVIAVKDDGVGSPSEQIVEGIYSKEEGNKVYALRNLRKRIELKYGTSAKMSYQSEIGVGTKVKLIFSLRDGEEGNYGSINH